jgi:hypothetical protein
LAPGGRFGFSLEFGTSSNAFNLILPSLNVKPVIRGAPWEFCFSDGALKFDADTSCNVCLPSSCEVCCVCCVCVGGGGGGREEKEKQ